MTDLKITVEKVVGVFSHPNADRLDLIRLDGKSYTVISNRGQYKENDKVVLFPPDSLLPESLITHFELSYLKKNRVKEAKIRGIISQALILPLSEVSEYSQDFRDAYNAVDLFPEDCDFSIQLGVTKYEPEEHVSLIGVKESGKLPKHVERYDLENAENHNDIFQLMYNEKVIITEKLEGTNWGLHIDENNQIRPLKRSSAVHDDGNPYADTAYNEGLFELIKTMKEDIKCETITLRGELIGTNIQSNIYGLDGKEIYLFDIMIDGKYVSPNMFYYLVRVFSSVLVKPIKTCPIVYEGLLSEYADNVENLKLMSNGISALNDKVLREGIVIKPIRDIDVIGFGRFVLKQRSPEYLANSKL